jgi:hypothetical protein
MVNKIKICNHNNSATWNCKCVGAKTCNGCGICLSCFGKVNTSSGVIKPTTKVKMANIIKLEYRHKNSTIADSIKTTLDLELGNILDLWPKTVDNYCISVYVEGKGIEIIKGLFSNLPMLSLFGLRDRVIWRGEFARFIDDNMQFLIRD